MTPLAFRTAMERHDLALIDAVLDEDVVVHSPVTARPFAGKDLVARLLHHARAGVDDFEYTDEIHNEEVVGLVFRGRIKGRQAEGLDLIRFGPGGLVRDLTVMIRPLFAAAAFNEWMTPFVEQVVGAPQDVRNVPRPGVRVGTGREGGVEPRHVDPGT